MGHGVLHCDVAKYCTRMQARNADHAISQDAVHKLAWFKIDLHPGSDGV